MKVYKSIVCEQANLGAELTAWVGDGWVYDGLSVMDDGLVLVVFSRWDAVDDRPPFVVNQSTFAQGKTKRFIEQDGHGWVPDLPKTFIDEPIPFDQDGEENVDGFAR